MCHSNNGEGYYLDYLKTTFTFPRNIYYAAKFRAVRDFIHGFSPGSAILDACCGAGFVTSPYTWDYRIYGVDIRPEAIKYCQGNHRGTYAVGDVYSLPFHDGKFDGVVINDAIEHLHDPSAALRELHRVIRPGGRIEVCTESYDSYLWLAVENTWYRVFGGNCRPYEHEVHPSRFTPKKMRQHLEEYFEVESVVLRNLRMKIFAVARKNHK